MSDISSVSSVEPSTSKSYETIAIVLGILLIIIIIIFILVFVSGAATSGTQTLDCSLCQGSGTKCTSTICSSSVTNDCTKCGTNCTTTSCPNSCVGCPTSCDSAAVSTYLQSGNQVTISNAGYSTSFKYDSTFSTGVQSFVNTLGSNGITYQNQVYSNSGGYGTTITFSSGGVNYFIAIDQRGEVDTGIIDSNGTTIIKYKTPPLIN